ncbi:MAG: M16 family metallopeptidase [Paracoccaceae bacterium]
MAFWTRSIVAIAMLAAPVFAATVLPARAIDITEAESPGGIPFWHVEEPSIPMVALEARFEGGAALDPDGQAGVSRLTMGLLDEGAGERDAVAFSEEADRLAARLGFSAGRDSASVSARMLVETMEPSADLLAEALTSPRFDADAVERVRRQQLSGIASAETDPRSRASEAFYARTFGDHPYGRPTDGTAETVEELTREDLVAQHRRLLTRDKAVVAVVGALDAEAAGRLVDRILGGLPAEAPAGGRLVEPDDATPPPGTEVVDLAVPQSVAIFGQPGLVREDEDYIPAYVMNYVLGGGGFSSRLMTEVREKRGLAYGVYSYLSGLEGAPLYLGSVATANARIAESLDVIRAEWARMAEEGVSEEELAKAKQYLTGAFPLRFDTNAKIASFLVAAQAEDLGIDYVNERNGLIEAVSVEDIRRVAGRLLDPDALSVVVVGQPEGL